MPLNKALVAAMAYGLLECLPRKISHFLLDSKICSVPQYKIENGKAHAKDKFAVAAPIFSGKGQAHVIICAMDYEGTDAPLTCAKDARNLEQLVRQCPRCKVYPLYNRQCTRENVKRMITAVGRQCKADDYFVFYYAGHGSQLPDQDGDEESGLDQMFLFVDSNGQYSYKTQMIDDEFAELVTDTVDEDVRVIVLVDACHSGTIADFNRECWSGRQAVSIAAARDSQAAGDTGRGGIMTHSLLLTIAEFHDTNDDNYNVGALYNSCFQTQRKTFSADHELTLCCPNDFRPSKMAWPLIPQGDYSPPYKGYLHHKGALLYHKYFGD